MPGVCVIHVHSKGQRERETEKTEKEGQRGMRSKEAQKVTQAWRLSLLFSHLNTNILQKTHARGPGSGYLRDTSSPHIFRQEMRFFVMSGKRERVGKGERQREEWHEKEKA